GAAAKEALFRAFFHDGRDIGDQGVLVDIARQIDLDPTIVADLLSTDADVVTVRAEEKYFREVGITGVPTYIANRQFAAQGAETPEKLARFIRHAAEHPPAESA
ncbi:MAG: disulfide bond formation protein DsbA, partial [Hyphomonas sp.]|nr:disulfide bond formation protein DsbA [Hyphomonas sp.]